MLKKLNEEQLKGLSEIVSEYIQIGLSTDRMGREAVTAAAEDFYEKVLGKKAAPVVFTKGPLEAWQYVVDNHLKEGEDESFLPPYFTGSTESHWVAEKDFYMKYTSEEVEIDGEVVDKWQVIKRMLECGYVYPLDEVCIVAEKPTTIHHTIPEGRDTPVLHCDGGPALEYADGLKAWSLNGVSVPQWLAETPSHQLDVKKYTEIENADVRTEFLRKVGLERMLEFGTKVDSYEEYDNEWYQKSQYELYDMKELFAGISYAPHLKMTNQTTGVFHVEAVAPSCQNIEDAVKDRFGGKELEIIGIA
jgi:hypothetical protein